MRDRKPACIYYEARGVMRPRSGTIVSSSYVHEHESCRYNKKAGKLTHYERGSSVRKAHRRKGSWIRRDICRCTIMGNAKTGELSRFDIYNAARLSSTEFAEQFVKLPRCPILKSYYDSNLYTEEEFRRKCEQCRRRRKYEEKTRDQKLEVKDF